MMTKADHANGSVLRSKNTIRRMLMECLYDWQLYLLLLPAVIYIFVFNYLPMYGLQIAFKDYRTGLGIWGSKWVGLAHFKRFIEFPNFRLIVMNTARIGLYTLATFPCSVILALLINELTNQNSKKQFR